MGGGKGGFSPPASRGRAALRTSLILHLWPLEAGENKFLLFDIICYGSHRKRRQEPVDRFPHLYLTPATIYCHLT